MRQIIAVLALVAAACGGEKGQPAATPGTPATPPPAAPAPTGTVHEVQMELVNGKYLFTPASLTIKTGDRVKWINASGGPHNVLFKKDRVPAGAQAILNSAMSGRIGDLNGPLLTQPMAVYEISFVNAPAGTYAYTCLPHETMGMNGTLTIQP